MFQSHQQHPYTTEILTLPSSFDRRITPGLQILILLAQKTSHSQLILDFSCVTNIDSTSFRRFFSWYNTIKSDQVRIGLVKPQAPLWTQFHVWHTSELAQIYVSPEEATWATTAYS